MKIGVIGAGVVGNALIQNFKAKFDLKIYDTRIANTRFLDVLDTEAVFLCLPSENFKDGEQDLTSLHATLAKLSVNNYENPVVIKTTVLPGTCERFQRQFQNLKITHNPEFLRQTTAVKDFADQDVVLIGGKSTLLVSDIYRTWKPGIEIMASSKTADTEFAKYTHNTFLAMKVVYMNELDEYQKSFDCNREFSRRMAASQGGIGKSHLQVPGPDGRYGYGGACFPKDVDALAHQIIRSADSFELLFATQRINKGLRKKI